MKTRPKTTGRRASIARLAKGGALAAGLLAVGPFTAEFADAPSVEATAQRVYGDKAVLELWFIEWCMFDCPGVGAYCCGPVA